MHYCYFEPGTFPESDFALVRGQVYLHKGVVPCHTDDGLPCVPPPVHGADAERDGGPIIGPTADEELDAGDNLDRGPQA